MLARVRTGAGRGALEQAMTAALARDLQSAAMLTPDEVLQIDARLLPAPRGTESLRADVQQPLLILGVVVGAVLLIACVNLASLMLARGIARQREMAVCRALGASRARLMKQLFLEAFVLATAGGAAGLLLAIEAGPMVSDVLTTSLGTAAATVQVDGKLIGTAGAAIVAATLLCGLIPAIRLTSGGRDLQQRAGNTSAPPLRIGRALIALQIAASIPLLIGAGLLLRTLHNLAAIEIGFNPDRLIIFSVDATLDQSDPRGPVRIYGDMLEQLETIPGVASATLADNALLSGVSSSWRVTIDGKEAFMKMNAVGPRFFETMEIPILTGRAVGIQDGPVTPRVVVINQAAARKFWPGASPLGRHFTLESKDMEIVGVAGDARYEQLRAAAEPTFYDPYTQREGILRPRDVHVMLRTSGDTAGIEAAIRRVVSAVSRDLPVTDVKTQAAQINETIGRERLFSQLLTAFGAFAMLLACIGIHGVTAYSVARRTNEIGIRLALGAQRPALVWLLLRQVLVLAAAGLAMGVAASYWAAPLVGSLLFGLSPTDIATVAGAAITMLLVAVGAAWLPARRAAAMDALVALRAQ
jgi:predicted permease